MEVTSHGLLLAIVVAARNGSWGRGCHTIIRGSSSSYNPNSDKNRKRALLENLYSSLNIGRESIFADEWHNVTAFDI